MRKKLYGLIGVLLLFASLTLFLKIQDYEQLAISHDDNKTSYGIIEGPPLCHWYVNPPERIMTEDKSQAIMINLDNPHDDTCSSTVSLQSPGFNISPAKDTQTISLSQKQNGSLSWIITPTKNGSHQIAIADDLNSTVFGITVTNMFGLNAFQAKIASLLGGLFGPMFTVPWWWDKIRGSRMKPKPHEAQ